VAARYPAARPKCKEIRGALGAGPVAAGKSGPNLSEPLWSLVAHGSGPKGPRLRGRAGRPAGRSRGLRAIPINLESLYTSRTSTTPATALTAARTAGVTA
jgi:hypothetical protein